jgi:2OG-Fe dioxygenase
MPSRAADPDTSGSSRMRVSTVSDDSLAVAPAWLDGIWSALARQGYALTDDREVGLPEKFRENFGQAYFNDSTLRHDPGDVPVDRQRARDVIRYQWHDDSLRLREHDTITLTDRAGIPGDRDHARVMLLGDPRAEELVRTILQLVPPSRRQPDGTFGVNLFRTFTSVVTTPHHDNEEFVVLYVLNRVGGGAESYLYHADDTLDGGPAVGELALRTRLDPGQILIFEDKLFKHGATPLEAPPGAAAMRDALVFTVDHHDSYLGQGRELAAAKRTAALR